MRRMRHTPLGTGAPTISPYSLRAFGKLQNCDTTLVPNTTSRCRILNWLPINCEETGKGEKASRIGLFIWIFSSVPSKWSCFPSNHTIQSSQSYLKERTRWAGETPNWRRDAQRNNAILELKKVSLKSRLVYILCK